MNKTIIHYNSEKMYQSYREGDWIALNEFMHRVSFHRVYRELYQEVTSRHLSQKILTRQAESLLLSGLKPTLLQKLGGLVVIIALDDVSGEEDPARILDLLARWQDVIDFSRVDLRQFCPGDIRDDLFGLMAQWIGLGAHAEIKFWALEAVWRRLPESVAMLDPILQSRPPSRAYFREVLALHSDDVHWYEKIISGLKTGRLSLHLPVSPTAKMETQLNLV